MNRKLFYALLLLFVSKVVWAGGSDKNKKVEQEQIILISTDYGKIKLKLYNATPNHRDNFIKLTSQHFFDSTLFHRVIKDFMIQGGDPESKHAKPGQMLGNGEPGYRIPAEFVDTLFHKKGALAAARDDNPGKESSGCQFYIVQGKVCSNAELDNMEAQINMQAKQSLFGQIINRPENSVFKAAFIHAQQTQNQDSLKIFGTQAEAMVNKEMVGTPFKYTEAQRKVYTTIGGVPHLDRNYTVFGEVVEGLDVLDKIASVQTGQGDRPVNDIRMTVTLLPPAK